MVEIGKVMFSTSIIQGAPTQQVNQLQAHVYLSFLVMYYTTLAQSSLFPIDEFLQIEFKMPSQEGILSSQCPDSAALLYILLQALEGTVESDFSVAASFTMPEGLTWLQLRGLTQQ